MPESSSDLTNSGRKPRTLARRLLRAFGALAMLAVGGGALLLTLLWLEHGTEITLPVPTGHFAVGRTTDTWVNTAQTDDLAPSPGVRREVLVWIWYPAASPRSGPPAEYLPPAWRAAQAHRSGVLMSQFLTRDPAIVQTHSSSDAGVSMEQP